MSVFATVRPMRRIAPILSLLALLQACTSIHPAEPASQPAQALPAAQVSTIVAPIRIDTTMLAATLDTLLSAQTGEQGIVWISGQDLGGGKSLQMGLNRSGSTSVSTEGGCLLLSVPLSINSGRIDWHTTVLGITIRHHFPFGGAVRLKARACTQLGPDWSLQTSIAPDFDWIEGAWIDLNPPFGHIKIGIANITTPKLREKLPALSAKVTEELARVPIRNDINKIWAAMQQPITLSGTPLVTAEIDPQALGVGAPTSEHSTVLVLRPSLTARVRIHAGAGASTPGGIALPPNAGDMGSDRFSASVRMDAPFHELNAMANSQLRDKRIDLGNGRSITINALTLSPSGKQLAVRVTFNARLSGAPVTNSKGWLYLIGTPHYDDASATLSIRDLDFDINTRNVLVKSAAVLLHEPLRKAISDALVFHLAARIDPMRQRALQGVHGLVLQQGVTLDALIDTIGLSDIYVGADGIGIFGHADGKATVTVQP